MQREGSVSSMKKLSVLNKGFELILCAQNDKCIVPLSFHIVLVAREKNAQYTKIGAFLEARIVGQMALL